MSKESIEHSVNMLKGVSKIVVNSVEYRLYIDMMIINVQNGGTISGRFGKEIDLIDNHYENQFKNSLLIKYYKSFKNLCRELDKLVTKS